MSQINVDTIANVSGTNYNFIKQVVSSEFDHTGYDTPSGNAAWTDLPNQTITITPSSTSSKILLKFQLNGYARNVTTFGFKILRGSTDITERYGYHDDPSYWQGIFFNFEYLDSPSTTSSTTYKVQFKANANYASLRMNWDAVNAQAIAMEVAG